LLIWRKTDNFSIIIIYLIAHWNWMKFIS
jgi:hypothetical protein